MDLESLSTQSTNIYEFDFLKEQKDHLMGFISSEFEWDTILQNLILAKVFFSIKNIHEMIFIRKRI